MLMMPLVENAFKHGSIVDGFLTIAIKLEIEGDTLIFTISNSFEDKTATAENGGLGLENIRKRLDLHYENNYTLQNELHSGEYIAKLYIHDSKMLLNDT